MVNRKTATDFFQLTTQAPKKYNTKNINQNYAKSRTNYTTGTKKP